MKVYEPWIASDKIYLKSQQTEFELQAELYSKLKKDGFLVKGSVGVREGKKGIGVEFDLVVYKKKEAIAIIETKCNCYNTIQEFEKTEQRLKYGVFGIPVILFWDISKYKELKEFLLNKAMPQETYIRAIPNEQSLRRLHKYLDIASMCAYDLRMHDLENDLEQKRNHIESLLKET